MTCLALQSGKTTTAQKFLPALIGAYGIKDHTIALRSGVLPDPLKPGEEGLQCCSW